MQTKHHNSGLSLLELLISLGLAGLLLSVLFQFFIGSMKSSNRITTDTALVTEAQLTQQLLGSKLIEASYIFPNNGNSITLGTSLLTKNYFNGGTSWEIGADPFIAGLLPPYQGEINHLFFAYYPMPRNEYINATQGGITLDPDIKNDTTTWVLLEYRKEILLPTAGVSALNYNDLSGGEAYLLAEYIEPTFSANSSPLDYTMFSFNTNSQSIAVALRMLKYSKGDPSCLTAQRYPKVNCTSGAIATPVNQPLQQEFVPRNYFMGSDFN